MKNARLVGISITLVLLLAITAGCVSTDNVEDTFDGEYDANEDTVLTVKCRNGNIKVTRTNGDKVDLHVDISAENQEKIDKLDIVVTEEGGNIDIETEFSGTTDEPNTDMTIKVPLDVHIESVRASNGNVEVRIDLSKGDTQISSSNGNVEVTVEEGIEHNLTASSSNGNVMVFIDSRENVDIQMVTSNGKVEIYNLDVILTTDEAKEKVGTMGTGGPLMKISTSNGNVDLNET